MNDDDNDATGTFKTPTQRQSAAAEAAAPGLNESLALLDTIPPEHLQAIFERLQKKARDKPLEIPDDAVEDGL